MGAKAPGDEASLDPSNRVGRIYVGNYYALLHDTIKAVGLMV